MHVTVVIHVELVPTLVFGAIRMHIAAAKSAAGRPSLRQLATVQPKLDFTSAQLVSTRVRHQLPTQKLNAPYPPPAQTDGPSAPQSEPAASIATTHHTRLTVPMTTVWAMGGSVVKPAMRHNISLMRQGYIEYYDPKPGTSISTLAYEYAPAFRVPEHAHGADQVIYATRGVMEVGADQVIYATRGVMEVSAGQSFWLIPPQFAIWIPARTMH